MQNENCKVTPSTPKPENAEWAERDFRAKLIGTLTIGKEIGEHGIPIEDFSYIADLALRCQPKSAPAQQEGGRVAALEKELARCRQEQENQAAIIRASVLPASEREMGFIRAAELQRIELAAAKQELEEVRKALKSCANERLQLINGACYADRDVGRFRDKYFDQDPPEGSMGTPEYRELNDLQAHLSGMCIGDDGEYMPRDKYDSFATPPSPAAPHSPLTARGDGETPRTDIIKRKLIAEVRNFLHDKSDELDLSNALECTVDLIRPIELDLARLKEELERKTAALEEIVRRRKMGHTASIEAIAAAALNPTAEKGGAT